MIRKLLQISTLLITTTFSRSLSMKSIRNDGMGGKGVIMVPKSGSYSSVVFWFHGLGDNADGWASMMPMLGLHETKFILPTAPSRPISINGGSSMNGWSDIFDLHKDAPEDRDGFSQSADRVKALIKNELDSGIAANKIIIGGFSQGGALALHVALRYEQPLAGCVALSTWLPLRDDFPAALSAAAQTLPILQVHGDEDRVVSHEWGQRSSEMLGTLISSPAPRFMTIEGMGHSSDPEEMTAVKQFISEKLA